MIITNNPDYITKSDLRTPVHQTPTGSCTSTSGHSPNKTTSTPLPSQPSVEHLTPTTYGLKEIRAAALESFLRTFQTSSGPARQNGAPSSGARRQGSLMLAAWRPISQGLARRPRSSRRCQWAFRGTQEQHGTTRDVAALVVRQKVIKQEKFNSKVYRKWRKGSENIG